MEYLCSKYVYDLNKKLVHGIHNTKQAALSTAGKIKYWYNID